MTSFEDRKDAFENKYAHDAALTFKVEARCAKLFGLWIAEKMGIDGESADAYAREVVAANLQEAGFEDIKRKARADLGEKNVAFTDSELDARIAECLDLAKKSVMEESAG